MNILILTIQKAPSFGACLQNYALYHYLCSLGHDCRVIDLARPFHDDYIPSKRYPVPVRPYRFFKSKVKNVLLHPIAFIRRRLACLHQPKQNIIARSPEPLRINHTELECQIKNFEDFESLIRYTRRYSSIPELYKNPPTADVYITGSDQAWNPRQPWCMEPYFLTFVKGRKKKITYATSIGLSDISENIAHWYRKWIKKLDCISIREQAGIDILKTLTNKNITKCCDPTFLIGKEEWLSIAKPVNVNGKYLYVFLLHDKQEIIENAKEYAKERGLQIIVQCHKYLLPKNNDISYEVEAGPLEWLSYIDNAEMVLTDSFHGTVFSLILNTPFRVIINNVRRGSRILDVLYETQTSHCIMNAPDNLSFTPIDFSLVNENILRMSKYGKNYLQQNI